MFDGNHRIWLLMVSRNWTNPLILIALTVLSACPAAFAQTLKNGSLTGKLTDLHSNPDLRSRLDASE